MKRQRKADVAPALSGQHTPGPWHVSAVKSHDNDYSDTLGILAEDETILARLDNWSEQCEDEAQANARLIAAAPELLAALRDSLLFFAAHTDGPGTEGKRLLEQARAAIAKAEGREE